MLKFRCISYDRAIISLLSYARVKHTTRRHEISLMQILLLKLSTEFNQTHGAYWLRRSIGVKMS